MTRMAGDAFSRQEWIRRLGGRLGIAPYQESVTDSWNRGRPLGSGFQGEVRTSAADRKKAIKKIEGLKTKWTLDETDNASLPLAQRLGVQGEIEAQARLGNQFNEFGEHIGVMPPLESAEVGFLPTAPDVRGRLQGEAYLQMPNLSAQGYQTLASMAESGRVLPHELARLAAEDALNRAWAARGGVITTDAHGNNAMGLPPGRRSPAADGSRTQIIDAGSFMIPSSAVDARSAELMSLSAQGKEIRKGYMELGMGDVGQKFYESLVETLKSPESGGTRMGGLMVSGALSDLSARAEAMNAGAWQGVESRAVRLAGETGEFPIALEKVRQQMTGELAR
jgi:hypothetical protein